jgi:hypothetical protein
MTLTKNPSNLKIEKLASNYIYAAKCQVYKTYASNDIEGDYGTWDDWFELLVRFGEELLKKEASP